MVAQPHVGLSTRFRIAPAATRALGSDLLVNVGGATAPVERLMGSGSELWHLFAAGCTVSEAAARLAAREGAPAGFEDTVLEFGASIVRAGLAEPIP